jgi:hypothetical protein
MNFSEFRRILGAEPRSRDPEFLRARRSDPEFERAAEAAELFEDKLERAFALPVDEHLTAELKALAGQPPQRRRWAPMALAASVLIAVGAAGLFWKLNPAWDSVDEYLIDHYRHDGTTMLTQLGENPPATVQAILAEFGVHAEPALADIVGVIKYCPTPDGRGVHMVLNTDRGPVTVIYMPHTAVPDGERLAFDGVEAVMVDLESGSAAIIGSPEQDVPGFYAMVHDSILASVGNS